MMKLLPLAAFAVAVALSNPCQAKGKTYKHDNGHDCVSNTGAKRASTGHVEIHFQNICDRGFSVRVTAMKEPKIRGTGILPGSIGRPYKMHITCGANDGCENGEWYLN